MKTQPQVVTTKEQAMTDKSNRGVGPHINPYASTSSSMIQDFMSFNPPTFHVIRVDEDPQSLIDEAFKVENVMGVTF